MTPQEETAAIMTAKASPAIAVAAVNQLPTITLPDIVNWATLMYLGLMISHKLWRMYKEYRTGKVARHDDE